MVEGRAIILLLTPHAAATAGDETPSAPRAPSSAPVATFRDYQRLLRDRPAKFDDAQSQYRIAQGKERCGICMHFFESPVSGYSVCEVVRPIPERPIHPGWVCRFFTPDGENYPLIPEEEKGLPQPPAGEQTAAAGGQKGGR
jgi:hypothetical protein